MKITPCFILPLSKDYNKLEANYRKQRHQELEEAFQSPRYWDILEKSQLNKDLSNGRVLKQKDVNGGVKMIPISLRIQKLISPFEPTTEYYFMDGQTKAGYVKIKEFPKGVYIAMIKNANQNKYGGVVELAQKIAVENCLRRGLTKFEIKGDAMWDSHAIHYLSGMRFGKLDNEYRAKRLKEIFGTSNINKIVKYIIENTPKGDRYCTSMLGTVGMHLKQCVIQKIISLVKKSPVLY